MYDKQIFSNNLQFYMAIHSETQADIAKLLNISKSNVTAYIKGEQIPRMDKIATLCDHYGIQVSDLLETKKVPVRIEDEQELDFIRRILALSPDQKSLLLAFVTALEGQAEARHDKP